MYIKCNCSDLNTRYARAACIDLHSTSRHWPVRSTTYVRTSVVDTIYITFFTPFIVCYPLLLHQQHKPVMQSVPDPFSAGWMGLACETTRKCNGTMLEGVHRSNSRAAASPLIFYYIFLSTIILERRKGVELWLCMSSALGTSFCQLLTVPSLEVFIVRTAK